MTGDATSRTSSEVTRYFYDTEFVEDGHQIMLVSIAIVASDGREYYAVSSDLAPARVRDHPWVGEHVWPYLPRIEAVPGATGGKPCRLAAGRRGSCEWLDREHPDVKCLAQIAEEVEAFLVRNDGERELWAWYGAYDHVALCWLWGPMCDLPRGIPMWTNDLRQEVQRLGNPELPKQAENEHHALADARWVRDSFNLLRPRG